MQIPALYKQMKMTPATPLAFSMPGEKDECICPLTLVRFLGENHNRFVERVDELLLMRGEEQQRSSARQGVVSSKFFLPAHALAYDFGAFLQFVEKQCVRHLENGSTAYDLRGAEQYLLDAFFTGKPLIDLEVRMMQFSNAGEGSVPALQQKVRQEPLSKEMAQVILKEVGSPSQARACLELLETCVSFLQATGGSFVQRLDVGEKTLGEYIRTVLLMKEADFGSRTISQQVRLKHIDSLWKLLRDVTVVDPFANVRPKYRESLDEKQSEALLAATALMDVEVLLPLLREFICGQLTEEHIDKESSLKATLGFLESGDAYLSDLPWFASSFPAALLMKHAMATYELLDRSRK
jgi:hypothetical protein